MKANESRIGNKTKQGKIVSFYEHGVHVGYGKCFKFSEVEPIPLTQQWLIKSKAYKVSDERPVYVLDRFRLIWKKEYKYWYVIDNVFMTYFTKLEFVHEWQNFYFVLNGEELPL